MKLPITIGAFVLLALIFVGGFFFIRKKNSAMGFNEIIKNPELWNQMVQESGEKTEKAISEAKDWSDEKLAAEVQQYIFNAEHLDDADKLKSVLEAFGDKIYPSVLKILNDASVHDKLIKPTGDQLTPKAPFNRACDLLGDMPPSQAVSAVVPFLNASSEYIRNDAAFIIGKAGTKDIIVPLQRALTDTDEYVRDHALIGLQYSVQNKRLADEARQGLQPTLERLVREGKNVNHAADLLCSFDAERAGRFFSTPEIFSVSNAALHEVLDVMATREIPVQRGQLLNLIHDLEGTTLEYFQSRALSACLHLLGQQRQPEDVELFGKKLASNNKEVVEGAAEGLLANKGFSNFRQVLWKKASDSGRESLNEKQRQFLAVESLDAEVNNGGWSQYFFNSSGDVWQTAMDGLKAMGSTDRLAIFQEAVAKFGKAGPSASNSLRTSQLAKLANTDEKLFDKLETRYYESKEVLAGLEAKFVIQNQSDFK